MAHEAIHAVEQGRETPHGAGVVRQFVIWAAVLLLTWGMVYYYEGVLIPLRKKGAEVSGTTHGNWSDLYHGWLAARELLWHGRNPYAAEMTREIQRGFYGTPDPKNVNYPEAFAYPIYVVFLFAPFLHLSFDTVRVVFNTLFLLLTAGSVLLWIRALSFRLRWPTVLLVSLIAMGSYPVVDGLHLEQLTLLVAGLTAGCMVALASGYMTVAALLLVVATVKPHLVILTAGFLLLWSVGDWRARKRFAIVFGGGMATILLCSELLLPGWLRLWRQSMQAYVGYVKPSLLGHLLGPTGAAVFGAVAIVLGLGMFWRFRKESPGSERFNFAIVVALILTVILVPEAGGAKYNQVLLIPAVLWLFIPAGKLIKRSGIVRATWLLAVTVLAGEWVLALPVSLAAFVLRHKFLHEATWFVAGPELLIFLFPMTLALFILSAAPQIVLAPIKLSSRAAV